MSESLDRQLNEAWRDAMLSYYLAHCISTALKDSLRTPNLEPSAHGFGRTLRYTGHQRTHVGTTYQHYADRCRG